LVESLRAAGFEIAIVTSGFSVFADEIANAWGFPKSLRMS